MVERWSKSRDLSQYQLGTCSNHHLSSANFRTPALENSSSTLSSFSQRFFETLFHMQRGCLWTLLKPKQMEEPQRIAFWGTLDAWLCFASFAPVKSPTQGLTAWRSNWVSEFRCKKYKGFDMFCQLFRHLSTFYISQTWKMKRCSLLNFFAQTWGFPTSLIYAHLFSTVFPLILIAALAIFKGPKLSLVLGVNVFLPGFTAAFGKYLIAFRCKPESEGGNLLTPFLPEFPGALARFWLNLISIAIRIEKLPWHVWQGMLWGSPPTVHIYIYCICPLAEKPMESQTKSKRLLEAMNGLDPTGRSFIFFFGGGLK